MLKLYNYIDGKFVPAKSGKSLENINPATGQVFSLVPDSGVDDIQDAVIAAKKAFESWSQLPSKKRHDYLNKIAKLIEERSEELAKAESQDNGKPLWLARKVDIPRAVDNFKFFATAILHFASESHEMPGKAINYTLRKPLGVVACISPWNLPLYLFSWKIAPALATGNTVVAKPSEITPLTAYLLAVICKEVGLPPGVLNIVFGTGKEAGEALVQHRDIKAISFTGGTKTGKHIASIAAPMFKKISLELGGKNPNIIFADCDFEKMMQMTMRSSFANQGQICLCGSRIFVERPLYQKFRNELVERTNAMVVGDPKDPKVDMGAIVSKAHHDKILSYIRLATEEGGKILTGGIPLHLSGPLSKGYFIRPTIIEGLSPRCRTNQEEIFGPVVTISPFDAEEEVLAMANSTPYGLSATLWTNNISRAHRMAARLDCGIVWINTWLLRDLRTPFGGTKQSGMGREGGLEVLRFFTEPKNVCIAY